MSQICTAFNYSNLVQYAIDKTQDWKVVVAIALLTPQQSCHAYAFLTLGLDEYEILLVAGHRKSLQIYIFKTDLLLRVNQKERICPCSLAMCCFAWRFLWGAQLLGPDPEGMEPQAARLFSPVTAACFYGSWGAFAPAWATYGPILGQFP